MPSPEIKTCESGQICCSQRELCLLKAAPQPLACLRTDSINFAGGQASQAQKDLQRKYLAPYRSGLQKNLCKMRLLLFSTSYLMQLCTVHIATDLQSCFRIPL